MPDSFSALGATLIAFLPNLLIAILILVVGWLVALAISKLVQSLLHRTTLDDRLAGALRGGQPDRIPIERWISLAVFWLIMLFVIVVFLNTLNLGAISTPFNTLLTNVLAFIPNLLAAAALAVVAFVIATVLRLVITRLLGASNLSKRLSDDAQVDPRNRLTIGQTIGNVVYWLVILLFLPAILDTLELQGILAPVQGMVDSILGALPNILGAAVILAVGYLVARIIRQIVANLLAGIGIDRVLSRAGVENPASQQRLSDALATIVFVLILIPVAIAALNVLNIPAISEPASNMLTLVLNAIPAIFGAVVLMALAYFVARFVGTLVTSLLASIGFNRLFSSGGLIPVTGGASASTFPTEGDPDMTLRRTSEPGAVQPGRTTPAEVAGTIVMITILLFAALEAANLLGFEAFSVLIGQFIVTATNILFGLVIFGLGLYLANLADRLIRGTGVSAANILAPAARAAILIFAGALALRQMGIAESIVNLAFGLLLGAVAVAAALAFGLGGRETAARQLEKWRGDLEAEARKPVAPPPPRTPPAPPPSTPLPGDIVTDPGGSPD